MAVQKLCFEMLSEYKMCKLHTSQGERIHFNLMRPGWDIYNITAPFVLHGERLIAGRVEPRDSEDSQVRIFRQVKHQWEAVTEAAPLHLQDPFVTFVSGQLVLGGVEIFPDQQDKSKWNWRTAFYCGDEITSLKRFAEGPEGMKDIRIKELPDGKILVFTRPQGERGGRGKIGCTIINNLYELTPSLLQEAPLIDDHFTDAEWGGVNEIHLLQGGLVGALSHIACFDEAGDRHYYASCFAMNPVTRECSDMKIIACRDDFPAGDAKRPDLMDVLFSGGLIRHGDGMATLYCGVSDAEAHRLRLPDPFGEYESHAL